MGLLDGKVALVTGAGGGLGRAHALALAAEGAKVVVNDLGGSRDGSGAGSQMADAVVAEIVAAGGQAVPDYGSVADEASAEAMVQRAVEAFGRLDIVVNNAGILRDKTLLNQTLDQWELVMAVHARGTFLVTRAAARIMLGQGEGGRIINTTSYAGLKGNFGQSNYAAAKAAIVGFTRTIALELRKHKITVNAIAPLAKTRMTEELDAVPADLEPADVSPLVVWLASELAQEVTGRVFGAHGSHYFEYVVEMTSGVDLGAARWTPAQIAERLADITRTEAERVAQAGPASGAASPEADKVAALLEALPGTLKADKVGSWAAMIGFEVKGAGSWALKVADGKAALTAGKTAGATGTITFENASVLLELAAGKMEPQAAFMKGAIKADNMDVLMKFARLFDLKSAATSIQGDRVAGAGTAPNAGASSGMNREAIGLKYRAPARFVKADAARAYALATEETDPRYVGDEPTHAPPLFAVVPMMEVLMPAIMDERLGADMLRLVHGEQEMIFHRPLKIWDLVAPRAEIVAIEERSSGEIVKVHQRLICEGEVPVEAVSTLFVRGKRREGAKAEPHERHVRAPAEREILAEIKQPVSADQATRYAHASGDHNPIHLDAAVAQAAGLPGVILHGLCTMAMATRALIEAVAGADPARLERIAVRFVKPVLPGQVLTTRVWAEGQEDGKNLYGFETLNEAGEVVLGQAHAAVRV
jgi:NAD(P)-dependent dehydrogenase (short-subunit alcohol dehydrogenase family)/acyl dehydratase